ncbi:MAG: type II toxin-antitoxin system VapC family toxin [Candidatus Dormibacteraceae bacterium]
MTSVADTGLLIAALNRGDRHHRWAVDAIAEARRSGDRLIVPEVVAGEAFTKLRYDRQISGRRDARPALAVFGMMAAGPSVFDVRGMPDHAYERAADLLGTYVDQAYSYVDAVVLLTTDDDDEASAVFTVDSSLAAYRFSRPVTVAQPGV